MNIYEIEQEFLAIEQELEENEGELTPELEERLQINEETFKTKVKGYTSVIKDLQDDIDAIKKEKDRLNNLQKTKERSIESLNKVLIYAVKQFGDVTKSNVKFVDYGTGKVSVTKSESVETNDGLIERTSNAIVRFFKWMSMNTLTHADINKKDIVEFVNKRTPAEEMDGIEYPEVTDKDLTKLKLNFNFDTDINTLLSTEGGRILYEAIVNYNNSVKGSVDKKAIKSEAKEEEHYIPTFAKINVNENLKIK